MSKKSKRNQKKRSSSGLKQHRRHKKKLLPPLAQLPNLSLVSWNPDMIPEMLLIDAVANQLTWERAPGALHNAFDSLDPFLPKESERILTGTASSLNLIPIEQRKAAVSALKQSGTYPILLPEGLRHGLALYPKCPARWLIEDWTQENRIDWEAGLAYLKGAVHRLWDSKSVYSTRCRMLPIARMIKHGKIMFSSELESMNLFPKYPAGLNEDEQLLVESSIRAMFNAFYDLIDYSGSEKWSPYFWRHNYEISGCEQISEYFDSDFVSEEEIQLTLGKISEVIKIFRSNIETATKQSQLDIYELNRDEILFGVLSRQYRFFTIIATNPTLWSADFGSMLHRVMIDAYISLKWLIQQNDPELFKKFKEYSIGNQKLLKLHVQELVDQGREDLEPFEEYLTESINDEIWEEFLSVNLGGNFAEKNMRDMAHEVGLREMYNLAYSPASSELHGEWTSLKRFNLVRCGNPLHRFHRLPKLASTSILSPYAVLFAGQILADTYDLYLDAYDLQSFKGDTKHFLASLEDVFSEMVDENNSTNL